jgi:hypothetical protein
LTGLLYNFQPHYLIYFYFAKNCQNWNNWGHYSILNLHLLWAIDFLMPHRILYTKISLNYREINNALFSGSYEIDTACLLRSFHRKTLRWMKTLIEKLVICNLITRMMRPNFFRGGHKENPVLYRLSCEIRNDRLFLIW